MSELFVSEDSESKLDYNVETTVFKVPSHASRSSSGNAHDAGKEFTLFKPYKYSIEDG